MPRNYLSVNNLKVSNDLLSFVNDELFFRNPEEEEENQNLD